MNVSSRGVLALGLGVFSIGCLVGPTVGQRVGKAQDADLRKTANNSGNTTAAAPAKPAALAVGSVDIEKIYQKYDKLKVQQEEFSAAAMKKQQELMRLQAEGKDEVAKLSKLTPNSVSAKKIEDHLTQLKAQIEAMREQAQRDLALRESELLAQTYKEIQAMVAALAQRKALTYVLQISNHPINASNPESVYADMSRAVVYSDPRNDLTDEVIYYLNANYKAAGGVAPKASNSNQPAGGDRPAPTNSNTPSAPPSAPSPRSSGTGNN
jgi:Skp family chaperone for outer membrane proteins